MDYEEGTSSITRCDAAASRDAELNNSPESSDNVNTAATGFEGKIEKPNIVNKVVQDTKHM